MGTGHAHAGTVTAGHRGRLVAVLGMTAALFVTEVVGGLLAHSLALLADAGHLAADGVGVGLSVLAVTLAGRPSTPERTFGWQRAEILAAAGNAVLLTVVAALVAVEAVRRLVQPTQVRPGLMAAFAVVALLGNGASMAVLHRAQRESLTTRGAFLEVAADAAGAAAVLLAAAVTVATGFTRADACASLLLAALILPRTWRLLRESVNVLLEATPRDVDLASVRAHLCGAEGVIDVHDLHAWTITSGAPVVSAHVVVEDAALADGGAGRVLDRLQHCLGAHFDVAHCTFQLEGERHAEHEPTGHA